MKSKKEVTVSADFIKIVNMLTLQVNQLLEQIDRWNAEFVESETVETVRLCLDMLESQKKSEKEQS